MKRSRVGCECCTKRSSDYCDRADWFVLFAESQTLCSFTRVEGQGPSVFSYHNRKKVYPQAVGSHLREKDQHLWIPAHVAGSEAVYVEKAHQLLVEKRLFFVEKIENVYYIQLCCLEKYFLVTELLNNKGTAASPLKPKDAKKAERIFATMEKRFSDLCQDLALDETGQKVMRSLLGLPPGDPCVADRSLEACSALFVSREDMASVCNQAPTWGFFGKLSPEEGVSLLSGATDKFLVRLGSQGGLTLALTPARGTKTYRNYRISVVSEDDGPKRYQCAGMRMDSFSTVVAWAASTFSATPVALQGCKSVYLELVTSDPDTNDDPETNKSQTNDHPVSSSPLNSATDQITVTDRDDSPGKLPRIASFLAVDPELEAVFPLVLE